MLPRDRRAEVTFGSESRASSDEDNSLARTRARLMADPTFAADVARENAVMAELDLVQARRATRMTQEDVAARASSASATSGSRPSSRSSGPRAVRSRSRPCSMERASACSARIFAARARQEAVGRNRHGDYDGARHLVEATARRIRGYAGRDPELRPPWPRAATKNENRSRPAKLGFPWCERARCSD